ncbi:MAG: SGNH/GDSL hydrolase family protein [Victivallales bacterium]|jgi:lysophospholipase L1-like esterase|nr:SGNH/GDSL hydrolase family protein [Victivallales bacterium]
MKTLLFQGDSITDAGRTDTLNFISPGWPLMGMGFGYPHLLASKICAEHPTEWTVLNRAVTGNRVVDLYARWKLDALNLKPDVISILIGINDIWHEFSRQNGVETPRFNEFYRRLLDWSLQSNPKMQFILLEPFALYHTAVTEEWRKEVVEKQEVVRQIAKDYNTIFIPLQSVFDEATKRAPGDFWLADGVHPTLPGHHLIAKAWLAATQGIF